MVTFGAANPVRALLPLVGNTPLLRVEFHTGAGQRGHIFAKYEALNFTGSVKDRMAAAILGEAYDTGELQPGYEIVEASSGNTAIAIAAMGAALHHPVRIFMPNWMSQERKAILRSFGATLREVTPTEGGFVGSIALAEAYAEAHQNTFLPRQFANVANTRAHAEGTGREILAQLASRGLGIDAFVAGVGTGGTVMGVGQALRQVFPCARIHPIQPAESPVLTTRRKTGHHRIQGISDEFIPALVNLSALSEPLDVADGDAILMAQKLAKELGLGVGISSGANVIAAIRTAETLPTGATVVTILCDSNKKYLSTDLFQHEPVKDGYLSPQVTFERFDSLPMPHSE